MGTHEADEANQGAGDQGLMFGYATNETETLMPAPIFFSHRLVERQAELRKSGRADWPRPDAKSRFRCGTTKRRTGVCGSGGAVDQHSPDIAQSELRDFVKSEIIEAILPAEWLTATTQYHINPTGNSSLVAQWGIVDSQDARSS